MSGVELVRPNLELGPAPDGVFTTVESAPKWAMMKMATVAKSKDQVAQMAALVKLVGVCVVEEDRDRLDDYLNEHDDAVDRLEEALTPVMTFWSGRPLEQRPASSQPSPLTESAPSSRVVSLSRGTVEDVSEPVGLAETWQQPEPARVPKPIFGLGVQGA